MSDKILCRKIRLRFDPNEKPGLLGIICNDSTLWVHHIGVRKFVEEVVKWSEYVAQHPEYRGLPSSLTFRSCVTESEGPYSYDVVYEFAADAVRSALPMILNAWRLYNLGDVSKATKTEFIIRDLAMQYMASHGKASVSANHIALAVLQFDRTVGSQTDFPEGLDFTTPAREARELLGLFKCFNLTPSTLKDALSERLEKRDAIKIEGNVMIMLDADARAFYSRLEKLRGAKDHTALQYWTALLAEPTKELEGALSVFQMSARQAHEEALRLSGKDRSSPKTTQNDESKRQAEVKHREDEERKRRVEAKRKEDEERKREAGVKRKEDEEREIIALRRASGNCIMCGRKLNLLARIFVKASHPECTVFKKEDQSR